MHHPYNNLFRIDDSGKTGTGTVCRVAFEIWHKVGLSRLSSPMRLVTFDTHCKDQGSKKNALKEGNIWKRTSRRAGRYTQSVCMCARAHVLRGHC